MRKTTLAKRNLYIWLSIIVILVAFVLVRFWFGKISTNIGRFTDITTLTKSDATIKIQCTRNTRLENEPQYDRALSLIEERYGPWEKSGESKGSWYFFPSQLVNCIKIVEGDIRDSSELEGYFIFNSSEIKENYFPITVNVDYSFTDDIVTALLLVHEITHVQQYIELLNDGDEPSCINKETEAFFAQLRFYAFQGGERRKSIDLRIEHDDNLHPQLVIIKTIKNQLNLDSIRQECFYGSGKSDEGCIDNYQKNEIKRILIQDDYYKRQCELN